MHNIKTLVYKFIGSLKTDKSEARNQKLETTLKIINSNVQKLDSNYKV